MDIFRHYAITSRLEFIRNTAIKEKISFTGPIIDSLPTTYGIVNSNAWRRKSVEKKVQLDPRYY